MSVESITLDQNSTEPGSQPLENDRQELFCQEYVKDFNGKQAAIRAGYAAKWAESTSSRLHRNVKVSDRVQYLKQQIIDSLKLEQKDIYSFCYQILHANFFDFAEFVTKTKISGTGANAIAVEVQGIDLKDVPYEMGRIIESAKDTLHGVELKLIPKTPIISLMADIMGMKQDPDGDKKKVLSKEEMKKKFEEWGIEVN